ncbi:hypothetical protein ACSNOI_35945 [Actinomadura kijaniata]|uniref:hypothetical protein n=1 Tax=Actinomadura kijaniata TaxID=46161 RepID=UPI003F1DDACB
MLTHSELDRDQLQGHGFRPEDVELPCERRRPLHDARERSVRRLLGGEPEPGASGLGFELTMRVPSAEGDEPPPGWARAMPRSLGPETSGLDAPLARLTGAGGVTDVTR